MIEMTLTGKDMADCLEQLGTTFLPLVPPDDLATELRRRMALQGLEVIIRKTDAPEDSPGVGSEPPAKRGPGRPRRAGRDGR